MQVLMKGKLNSNTNKKYRFCDFNYKLNNLFNNG